MHIRQLFRCLMLFVALASAFTVLGACHTSPRRTWNKTFHNR
jgi:hypothetical protein